jgi:hypothetical protein
VVAALVILGLLVTLLVLGVVLAIADVWYARRITKLESQFEEMTRRINTVSAEVRTSHARLVDGLWQRASVEVDREIEKARARGRNY